MVMGLNLEEIKTKKKTFIGLGLGQIVSLLCTCNVFTSSELARKGINVPTTQSFLSYTLLAIVYGGIMLYKNPQLSGECESVHIDNELLDCWAIPCVLVLTYVFLKTRYRLMKISGVVICILGVVLVVFSDVHAGSRAGGSNPVKGNILVVAGATLYAVSNTTEEFFVKNANIVELLAFFGFFSAVISAIQIGIFESGELRAIEWSAETICSLDVFHLTYSLLPVLLETNGSAMFTLSLLTSDMWAVLIRIFAYHEKVDWLYYLAFATTAIGLIIYSMKEKDEEEQKDEQRKLLDEEDGETRRVT